MWGAADADNAGNFVAAVGASSTTGGSVSLLSGPNSGNSPFAPGGGLDVMAGIGSTGGDVEVSAGDSSVLAGGSLALVSGASAKDATTLMIRSGDALSGSSGL